jgi:MFS family permease
MPLRWRIAVFLFFAAGLNYADRVALSSVIPPLREDLGITDAQIGFAGMIFLWAYAIVSPFAGWMADRFSRARLVLLSLVAWSAVTVLTGFAESFAVLVLARLLLGIAESFYLPAAGALLADHHGSASMGRAVSVHMLGLNLGLVLGGAVAGVIAEHYGWRPGFWLLGGLGLILAILGRAVLRDRPEPVASQAAAMAEAAGPPSVPKVGLREAWGFLLNVRTFHCLLMSSMAAGVAVWIFLSWLPLFLSETYGMGLGTAGMSAVLLYKAPVFVGIALGGWLSDWWVRRDPRARVLVKGLSFLLGAPFLALFLGTPGFTVVVVIMVTSSLLRAMGTPSEHPIISETVPPPYRAAAIGLLNTVGTGAGGVGVLVAGVLKGQYGLHLIFGACSAVYFVAGVLMLLAYRKWIHEDLERARRFSPAGAQPTAAA